MQKFISGEGLTESGGDKYYGYPSPNNVLYHTQINYYCLLQKISDYLRGEEMDPQHRNCGVYTLLGKSQYDKDQQRQTNNMFQFC